MANIKSAIKDIRRSERRATFNKRMAKRLKAASKRVELHLKGSDLQKSKDALVNLQKIADKAAKKGCIKKATASRKKSRLAKRINKLETANVQANKKNS